jgi:hypothetical protein
LAIKQIATETQNVKYLVTTGEQSYPLQKETGEIIGLAYEIKKILGTVYLK